MSELEYVGTELAVFAHATNWKAYVRSRIRRYLSGRVLEVGAGMGAVTQSLYDGTQTQWVCLEPDRKLAERIPVAELAAPERCVVRIGTLADLAARDKFDCVLYFDVLEHIQGDAAELLRTVEHLQPGGRIVVVSPALPSLYTEFDSAIGHYRRYTKKSLRAIAPPGLQQEVSIYLDWAGALASLGNRLFLHSPAPKLRQILFWDRVLVPISRMTDAIIGHAIGRSILVVWRKPQDAVERQRQDGAV